MSGTYSKYFPIAFENICCRQILHPNKTCAKWWREMMLYHAIIGAIKFYLPVCVISHLLKIKKWNKMKTWKEFLEMMKGSFIFGYGFISSIFIGLCIEYHVLGRYYSSFYVVLPVFIGTLFTYFLPRSILKTESVGLFNIYLEFLIRRSKSSLVQKIRKSKILATLIFSFLNTFIMCGMFKENCPNLWFSKFYYKQNDTEKNPCECVHGNLTCHNYLSKEIRQTINFGLGICTIKALLPRVEKLIKTPRQIPKILLRNFDYKLMGFLVGMNGGFKIIFCFLNNLKIFSSTFNCTIASFISGFSYFLFPRYEIFTLAVLNAITMLFKNLIAKIKEKLILIPIKQIENLPIYHLLMIMSTSLLVQLRIFHPYYVNKIVSSFVAVGSNGKANFAIEKMIGILMGFEVE